MHLPEYRRSACSTVCLPPQSRLNTTLANDPVCSAISALYWRDRARAFLSESCFIQPGQQSGGGLVDVIEGVRNHRP